MFGLPAPTFYHTIPASFMYLPTQDTNILSQQAHFLTSTPDGKGLRQQQQQQQQQKKRKQTGKSQAITKRFCEQQQQQQQPPVKKCCFDIASILKPTIIQTKPSSSSSYPKGFNASYADHDDDTEDGSSEDGQTHPEPSFSFRSPPISSYALFNQLKSLDMSITGNNKSELTPSSSSESEQSPYRPSLIAPLNNNKIIHARDLNHKNKPKRIRTIFTPEQLERLESEFDKQQYMVGNERFYLATTLALTEAQVKVWFQNRRIKWRRQSLDDHQQRLSSLVGKKTTTTGMFQENDQEKDSDSDEKKVEDDDDDDDVDD